jgi:ligand-binding sensor domain-containing protein/signal transduction histidine kinase/DNA-binding response OmpR family regulator
LVRFRFISSLILVCCVFVSRGQPHYFRSYGVTEGMSGNSVTSILQDSKGFMWFGTRNGLNRFDGTSFKIYTNILSDSLSIGSNSIVCLFGDKSGQLWVGTHKGIYIYDPRKELFTPFRKLPQIDIRAIIQDSSDNIWIIAGYKLFRYNTKNGQLEDYKFKDELSTALRFSSKGELWVGTNNGTIKKYDDRRNNFIEYNVTTSIFNQKKIDNIRDIYPVTDSTILVGMLNQVLMLNINTKQTKNVFQQYSWANDIKVRCIFPQSDSLYWIGSETGLYTINVKTGEGSRIHKEPDNPYSITDNVIFSISKDSEGGTWIGTFYGGVNYSSDQYNRFQKYFHHAGPAKGFKGNVVHEITADPSGNFWVGTEDAGLNKIDGLTGKVRHFAADKKQGSISYNKIHGLLATKDELWIGTLEHGLDVMDLKTEKVIRHYDAGNDSNSLKSDFIVSIFQRRNGSILVGTRNGLFRYNRIKDNFSPLPPFDMPIQAMHEDNEGTLWLCSYGQGVYYTNAVSGKNGTIRHLHGNAKSLINDYVNNIFEDSKGNLWFCTEEGLTKYNKNSGEISNYTTKNGLPDNQVFRALEDDLGYIWISTSHGLVQLDPVTQSVRKYGTASGLISEQFNYNSAFKSGSTLLFGTVKGLIGFNPAEFIQSTFVPPVYLTDIQVNNREIDLRDEKSPLKTSITYSQHLKLSYDQSDLSFSVAALSYAAPEKNEYKYMLEGLEKEWVHLKGNRKIFYTKLPPGKYTFRVKGSNNNERWNPKETTLRITISPPWWLSVWAFAIYASIILAIVITIVRYYHMAMKERSKNRMEAFKMEKEREIYHAKIEFFTNVTHEIRTPLTLIKLPIDQLMKKEIEDQEIKTGLDMINKNTNRLIDLSNQLLDFRKAEANKYSLSFIKSNVSALLSEEFKNFKLAAEQKNLQYKLELCRIEPHAYLDPEAFTKILSNLFSNAIKYAGSTVIVKLLPFGSDDDKLNIEFRNDGPLIPQELKEKIFEPFYRIKETDKQPGTGIGLPLARSLAELHKGELTLKQQDGGMNIFLLSLPVEQDETISFHNLEPATDEDQAQNTNACEEPAPNAKPAILIVEDNKEILGFLQKSLNPTYKVFQALNGGQALEILQKENISLVVSDIMMPVMDGIELCKCIKTDLQYSHVPIILLTAKNTLASKITGLEVGADAYIEKPFSLEHLQAQIINLITNRDKLKEYFASSPLTHLKGIACSLPDKDFLERLNSIINDKISNAEIDVEQLSVLMNMSRSTLYRKIKVLSNLTPNEFISLSRLKKAAELLSLGHKVSEVSDMIGYTLQNNFSRDFHKQFGLTPTSYVNGLYSAPAQGKAQQQ